MPKQFTKEDMEKSRAAKAQRDAEVAVLRSTLPQFTIHGGRLSLADYLNEPEPPFLTPLEAIRLRCLDCLGNSHSLVHKCEEEKCFLWRYRLGVEEEAGGRRVSRTRAIRSDCLDCCGNSSNEVQLCPAEKCPVWPYRLDPMYKRPSQAYWSTHRTWKKIWDASSE
jgi:hypothetical protein